MRDEGVIYVAGYPLLTVQDSQGAPIPQNATYNF